MAALDELGALPAVDDLVPHAMRGNLKLGRAPLSPEGGAFLFVSNVEKDQ